MVSIPAHFARSLERAATELGAELGRPDGNGLARWLARGVASAADPAFALRVGQHLPPSALGAFGYALRCLPTAGHALEQATVWLAGFAPAADVRLLAHSGVRRLRFRAAATAGPEATRLADLALGVARATAGELLGARWRPLDMEFEHPVAPCEARAYRQVAGCEVRFGTRSSSLSFDEDRLAAPLPGADLELAELLVGYLARRTAAPASGRAFADAVRTSLSAAMRQGEPSLAATARALHVSPRTLQRRLSEHRLSYRELVDDVRLEHAIHHLRCGELSIGEIASRVGFRSRSSFSRAFRRRRGESPSRFRR